mmetsp:Transcript_29257/g.83953  ORF Transcript_29257/g.83953 Transcript_29257/m.83953 type:complete len:334 (+) Transcript_29257:378-1379(+)
MLHASYQLLGREQSVALRVQGHELIAELLDLELRQLPRQQLQNRALQLVVGLVIHEALEDGHAQRVLVPVRRGLRRIADPRVRQGLGRAQPRLAVLIHEFLRDIHGLLRAGIPQAHGKVHRCWIGNLGADRRLIIARDIERVPTGQQLAEDDADAENVSLLIVIPFDHLRGHVVRSACLLHHLLALVPRDDVLAVEGRDDAGELAHDTALRDLDISGLLLDFHREVGEAEVDYLDGRARGAVDEENVLGFHVPVHDVEVVAVLRRRQDLFHHEGDVALRHGLLQPLVVVQDAREQIAALAQLRDHVDVARDAALPVPLLVVHLVHLHDVGVVQ